MSAGFKLVPRVLWHADGAWEGADVDRVREQEGIGRKRNGGGFPYHTFLPSPQSSLPLFEENVLSKICKPLLP